MSTFGVLMVFSFPYAQFDFVLNHPVVTSDVDLVDDWYVKMSGLSVRI